MITWLLQGIFSSRFELGVPVDLSVLVKIGLGSNVDIGMGRSLSVTKRGPSFVAVSDDGREGCLELEALFIMMTIVGCKTTEDRSIT